MILREERGLPLELQKHKDMLEGGSNEESGLPGQSELMHDEMEELKQRFRAKSLDVDMEADTEWPVQTSKENTYLSA